MTTTTTSDLPTTPPTPPTPPIPTNPPTPGNPWRAGSSWLGFVSYLVCGAMIIFGLLAAFTPFILLVVPGIAGVTAVAIKLGGGRRLFGLLSGVSVIAFVLAWTARTDSANGPWPWLIAGVVVLAAGLAGFVLSGPVLVGPVLVGPALARRARRRADQSR